MSTTGTPHRPDGDGSASLSERVRSLRLADKTNDAAPPRLNKVPWVICLVLLGMTALFGYRAYRVGPALPVEDSEEAASSSRAEGRTPGASSGVPASTGEVVLQAKGYVTLLNPVQVGPIVGGRLKWVSERLWEGTLVKRGEKLAKVEDDDYQADVNQAKAACEAATQRYEELKSGNRPEEIKQAEAEWEEATRTLRRLRLDMDRSRRLSTTSALATRDYEEAKYGHDAQEARAQRLFNGLKLMRDGARMERKLAAEAEMKQARATLAKMEWRLANTVVKSPLDGIILSKRATEGQQVNPAALGSGISASLCDIADPRDLEIDLSIQERDIASIVPGMKCLVMPEAYQNHEPFLKKYPRGYEGYVARLMPQADRAKGAIPVRVRIPRESLPLEEALLYLRPETGALVTFLRGSVEPTKPTGAARQE